MLTAVLYADRKPIDPPPIIELKVTSSKDPGKYVYMRGMTPFCGANHRVQAVLTEPLLVLAMHPSGRTDQL